MLIDELPPHPPRNIQVTSFLIPPLTFDRHLWRSKNHFVTYGSRKKSSSTNGQAIKRGYKGRAIKEKGLFYKLFEDSLQLSSRAGGGGLI